MPPLRNPALRAAIASILLASCAPEIGQTALVVDARTDGPIDCLVLSVSGSGGEPVRATTPVSGDDWRGAHHRLLVYSGGTLGEGAVHLEATGHRGGCEAPIVARAAADATFARGEVREVPVTLALVATDGDGDGYADPDDCDPNDATVHPADGTESGAACNGRDDDCDGDIDEGCPCRASRPCHPLGLAHPSTGVGSCVVGTQVCQRGVFAGCTGAVLPGPESCDGVDTDCDGTLDPTSCPCTDGATRPCYDAGPARHAGVGACVRGVQTCASGTFGACVGSVAPTRETCNAVDDDCNGVVDDEGSLDVPPCPKQVGVCAGARPACNGGPAVCTEADYARTATSRDAVYVADEAAANCDGADNDCDGTIDEGCVCIPGTTEACHPLGPGAESATGACRRGTRTCLGNGSWGTCDGAVEPRPEACNAVDDDCDGTVDEDAPGVGEACATGLPGQCAPGERRCVSGTMKCEPLEPAVTEVCNGRDDDCNGTIDNGFDKQNDAAHCGTEFECFACGPGESCCGGRCANTGNDELHCGACGNDCEAGETCCGGGCADLSDDAGHCGACGVACAGGLICRGARCVPAAETTCTDAIDEDNDGKTDCADPDCVTGTLCEPVGSSTGRICRNGACVPPGEASCNDGIDEDNDGASDCGDSDCDTRRCDATNGTCCAGSCSHETTCTNGTDDDCDGLVDAADPDCPCTGTRCGNVCVNTLSDMAHCGGCNQPCGDTNSCTNDVCASGVCTHPNVANRGQPEGCNGSNVCCSGSCVGGTETACTDGADNDCDGARDCFDTDCPCAGGTTCCSNGCKNTQTDKVNCGGCGQICATTNVCAAAACAGGNCNITTLANRTACGSGLTCCGGECGADTETACGDGVDNDCDGLTDCADPDCANKGPAEICNGVDDNCDAAVDEGFNVGTACSAGHGLCYRTGQVACLPDGTSACNVTPDTTKARTETCNGVDDNCDGNIDEVWSLGTACSAGTGVCKRTGAIRCMADGSGAECSVTENLAAATREKCDTADNDCDGAVDERPACGGPNTDLAENGVVANWGHSTASSGNGYCATAMGSETLIVPPNTANIKTGSEAVRLESGDSSAWFGAHYPKTRDANFDLSSAGKSLTFQIFGAFTDSDWSWQNNGPHIVLCSASGYRVLVPTSQRLTGTYTSYTVPVAGNASWTVQDNGTFDLTDVDAIEFHADPNRPSGDDGSAVLFIDDVRFN